MAPNSFWWSTGRIAEKKFLASRSVFRKYSKTPPWNCVGSGLQDVIRYALPFVHGLGAGRLHLKLLHSLHGNAERQVAGIALRPGAGHRQTFDVHLVLIGLAAVERAGGWTGRLRAVIVHPAGKPGKRRGIARRTAGIHGQRKRIVHPVIHRGTERHIVRLQGGRLGFHGDRLVGRADLSVVGFTATVASASTTTWV